MSGMTKTLAGAISIRPFRVPTISDAGHAQGTWLAVSGQ
jgi:hypothetical protein